MSERVLDASVMLALLKGEAVYDFTFEAIEGAVMSAVNVAEVLSKASNLHLLDSPGLGTLFGLLERVEPFTPSQARLCARLRGETKAIGLSLDDHACLALALELEAHAYTADRLWAELKVGCPIHLVR